jgi:hypothetical protein
LYLFYCVPELFFQKIITGCARAQQLMEVDPNLAAEKPSGKVARRRRARGRRREAGQWRIQGGGESPGQLHILGGGHPCSGGVELRGGGGEPCRVAQGGGCV